MITKELLRSAFDAGLDYAAYVRTGTAQQQGNWSRFHAECRLGEAQGRLIKAFTRSMPVLVISGVWCGDCVQQCPLLAHIEAANPERIRVRFIDRDEHINLADRLRLCGGHRVPIAIFMAEDFEFVSLLGDRTLSRYRAIAARQLGPSCPLPGAPVPPEEVAATMQDWVNEFERVHLLLRLSPRLRQSHND